jgi:hypothetical protein
LAGRSSKVRGLRAFIEFSAVFILAASTFAQVDRSGLTGTVTDPSGRVLAGTHITAVENSTQLQRETVSDSTGNYAIPELPVDTYTITFEHPGFQTLKFVDVEQVIGRTQTLDAMPRECLLRASADGPQHQRGDRLDRARAGE